MEYRLNRWSYRFRQPLLLAVALFLFAGQLALTQHELDHAPGADQVCLQCANLSDRPALTQDARVERIAQLHEHPWVAAAVAVVEPASPTARARAPPILLR